MPVGALLTSMSPHSRTLGSLVSMFAMLQLSCSHDQCQKNFLDGLGVNFHDSMFLHLQVFVRLN